MVVKIIGGNISGVSLNTMAIFVIKSVSTCLRCKRADKNLLINWRFHNAKPLMCLPDVDVMFSNVNPLDALHLQNFPDLNEVV